MTIKATNIFITAPRRFHSALAVHYLHFTSRPGPQTTTGLPSNQSKLVSVLAFTEMEVIQCTLFMLGFFYSAWRLLDSLTLLHASVVLCCCCCCCWVVLLCVDIPHISFSIPCKRLLTCFQWGWRYADRLYELAISLAVIHLKDTFYMCIKIHGVLHRACRNSFHFI